MEYYLSYGPRENVMMYGLWKASQVVGEHLPIYLLSSPCVVYSNARGNEVDLKLIGVGDVVL